jgi:carboxylesterase
MMDVQNFRNPHLEGETFYWRGGPVGVLLIHGFTATTAEVRPLARTLVEHGFTVAGPLLPGHGTRPEDLNRVRWQDWTRAVEETYRQLAARCERVVVGGESLGGLLALHLAAAHPEVAAVLTFAPAIKVTVTRAQRWALRFLAYVRPMVDKHSPDNGLAWQGYTVVPLRGGREVMRLQKQVWRSFSSVRQPILVVQGRQDHTVSLDGPDILLRRVRSTMKEAHWLAASGHCVILDCQWDEAARLTLDFLGRALQDYSSVMVIAPSAHVDSQV